MEQFGRYGLGERLGRGGMAEVFEARVGERAVAVKRVLPHLGEDREFRAMFLDEVTLALKLHHPNIVAALDAGDQDGVLFLTMELVEGAPLHVLARTLVRAGQPFPLAAAVTVAEHMCSGLHYAHTLQGADGLPLEVVHRDVSPQNVLVRIDGTAKVADFGIARARQRLTKTGTGILKGKPSYMAPEQVDGSTADARVDQFATAVVLWELIAGRALFVGPNEMAVLERVARCVVEPLHQVRADVPRPLSDVIARALSSKPSARYPSMRAFGTALEEQQRTLPPGPTLAALVAFARGEPLSSSELATAPTVTARPAISPKLPPRKVGLAAVAGAGVAAVLALTSAAVMLSTPTTRSASDAGSASPSAAPVLDPGPIAGATPAADGGTELYAPIPDIAAAPEMGHHAAELDEATRAVFRGQTFDAWRICRRVLASRDATAPERSRCEAVTMLACHKEPGLKGCK